MDCQYCQNGRWVYDFNRACCRARHALAMMTKPQRSAMVAAMELSDPQFAEAVKAEIIKQHGKKHGDHVSG